MIDGGFKIGGGDGIIAFGGFAFGLRRLPGRCAVRGEILNLGHSEETAFAD